MSTSAAPGWYPDPGSSGVERYWDGEAWTTELRNQVGIACPQCGAGHTLAPDTTSFRCLACSAAINFIRCRNCRTINAVVSAASSKKCPNCNWETMTERATAATKASVALFDSAEMADPDRRVTGGTVIAVSGIPTLLPGRPCGLRFNVNHIDVMGQTAGGWYCDIDIIPYGDVELLEISGPGKETFTTSAGLSGGGIGADMKSTGIAAFKSIWVAEAINYLTRSTTTTVNTHVHLKVGKRELLICTATFDTPFLNVLLAPVYERIRAAHVDPVTKNTSVTEPKPTSTATRLKELSELHEQGIVSDTEFAEVKARLLKEL